MGFHENSSSKLISPLLSPAQNSAELRRALSGFHENTFYPFTQNQIGKQRPFTVCLGPSYVLLVVWVTRVLLLEGNSIKFEPWDLERERETERKEGGVDFLIFCRKFIHGLFFFFFSSSLR